MSPGKAVDEDAKKLFEEGIEYYDQRDAPKAIECFDAVIKLNPTYPYVWTWRGMAYMDDDRCETYAEALSGLNRAIENETKQCKTGKNGLSCMTTKSGRRL